MSLAEHLDAVRDYYDKNTASFLRFGEGGDLGAIHRAVWAPEVKSREEAFRFIDEQILAQLPGDDGSRAKLLDLGCGVGASLVFLAQARPCQGVGVTLSPVQATLGNRRIKAAGLDDRIRIEEASYLDLPTTPPVDLAFAIESFSLGPDPQGFFEQASQALRTGGRLVVCDDFLASSGASAPRDARLLDRFRRGWHAGSLVTAQHADTLAETAGLSLDSDRNLTRYLALRRPRDRLISIAVNLGGWLPIQHPWWSNLLGGDALQRCLATGLVEYRFRVWTKN